MPGLTYGALYSTKTGSTARGTIACMEQPGYPFKKSLQEMHIVGSKLLQFKNDPTFIIRRYGRESEEFDRYEPTVSLTERASKTKSLLEEFNSRYHPCAPVHFIVAKEDNEEVLYIATKRIPEIPKTRLSPEQSEKYYRECTTLLETFVKYCEDKFESKEEFLTDVTALRQYVYTKKKGGRENHLYLVDTDPFFSNVMEDLDTVVSQLEYDIEEFEKESGVKLEPLLERCELLRTRIQNYVKENNGQ
jgi:hypothetical protein